MVAPQIHPLIRAKPSATTDTASPVGTGITPLRTPIQRVVVQAVGGSSPLAHPLRFRETSPRTRETQSCLGCRAIAMRDRSVSAGAWYAAPSHAPPQFSLTETFGPA
jgi:hypothetical protein